MDGATSARVTHKSRSNDESTASEDEATASEDQEDSSIDTSRRKDWDISPFQPSSRCGEQYGGRKAFTLTPRWVQEEFRGLEMLNFLHAEAGSSLNVEVLQVNFSGSGPSEFSLDYLEICRLPPRPPAPPAPGGIGSPQYLTKLTICHFSIRYLPPEIGHLKNLEELDLSFNKLRNLPCGMGELNGLKSLRVANNKLVDLPSGISSMRRLENLDLSNNRLTSLTRLRLGGMQNLQYLNLQYNKLHNSCQIPSWICCIYEGNKEDIPKDKDDISFVEVNVTDAAVHNAYHSMSSSVNLVEGSVNPRCPSLQRMEKGRRCCDSPQQRARQERLNYSRSRVDNSSDDMIVKMAEEDVSLLPTPQDGGESGLQFSEGDKVVGHPALCKVSKSVDIDDSVSGDNEDIDFCPRCFDENGNNSSNNISYGDESSCITDPTSLCDRNLNEDECQSSPQNGHTVPDFHSSVGSNKSTVKSKRHCDTDPDNPKPKKYRRPPGDSFISCKYNVESFCSINDYIPDGFYDAGRDRWFMPLEEYEQSLCLDSREVILLDRHKDEELDAIASSAQMLLSTFRSYSEERKVCEVDNLQRASILALFVSDCFGGSDRSASVLRFRKAVVGFKKQQPFICTCRPGSFQHKKELTEQTFSMARNFNFSELCENSLRAIKTAHTSNVVPIGSLRFGVCRHRAVLMKYLCDRADPPIPCELVRGYMDFMPHAWNTVHIKKGNSWVRWIIDACCPTDIREETDAEYFCRYIPLCRIKGPSSSDVPPLYGTPLSSPIFPSVTVKASQSVFYCKFGSLDSVAKVRNLESSRASLEEIRNFEYSFLGEVRMLGALKKHSCIVEIYGHQLSSRWAPPVDGNKENRLLQSIILMECIKGGSVKNYLDKLSQNGEKHVPSGIALCVARNVACALVELHSKQIIHRDIKSENILIDLECRRTNGSPVVKLADFDQSVPLQSFMHTCCNAHLGVHPPDVCVGTPRWMAPEVVQAMHQRHPYGLEVDIWSYGCLLYELLTLQVPYYGQSEAEIYEHLQGKRPPKLTAELEALANKVGADADTSAKTMKLLVELFKECTSGDPAERPTAEYIYDKLIRCSEEPDAAQTSCSIVCGSNSSSSSSSN